ncbi:hypothetical protein BDK51DRAFT_37803, partial [Blyttiomyces helicus]
MLAPSLHCSCRDALRWLLKRLFVTRRKDPTLYGPSPGRAGSGDGSKQLHQPHPDCARSLSRRPITAKTTNCLPAAPRPPCGREETGGYGGCSELLFPLFADPIADGSVEPGRVCRVSIATETPHSAGPPTPELPPELAFLSVRDGRPLPHVPKRSPSHDLVRRFPSLIPPTSSEHAARIRRYSGHSRHMRSRRHRPRSAGARGRGSWYDRLKGDTPVQVNSRYTPHPLSFFQSDINITGGGIFLLGGDTLDPAPTQFISQISATNTDAILYLTVYAYGGFANITQTAYGELASVVKNVTDSGRR